MSPGTDFHVGMNRLLKLDSERKDYAFLHVLKSPRKEALSIDLFEIRRGKSSRLQNFRLEADGFPNSFLAGRKQAWSVVLAELVH